MDEGAGAGADPAAAFAQVVIDAIGNYQEACNLFQRTLTQTKTLTATQKLNFTYIVVSMAITVQYAMEGADVTASHASWPYYIQNELKMMTIMQTEEQIQRMTPHKRGERAGRHGLDESTYNEFKRFLKSPGAGDYAPNAGWIDGGVPSSDTFMARLEAAAAGDEGLGIRPRANLSPLLDRFKQYTGSGLGFYINNANCAKKSNGRNP